MTPHSLAVEKRWPDEPDNWFAISEEEARRLLGAYYVDVDLIIDSATEDWAQYRTPFSDLRIRKAAS